MVLLLMLAVTLKKNRSAKKLSCFYRFMIEAAARALTNWTTKLLLLRVTCVLVCTRARVGVGVCVCVRVRMCVRFRVHNAIRNMS